jgi:hypothetical protein
LATEFTVYLADRCEEADVLAFVAGELDGAELHPEGVCRDDLAVVAWRLDAGERASWGRDAILGIPLRTQVRLVVLGGISHEARHAAR